MPVSRINTLLFPGKKRKALTLSYDDGVLQDRRLVKMMRKYGIKGTFNLNSSLLGRTDSMDINGKNVDISTVFPREITELYCGFEIATHGAEHSALTGFGSAGLYEILKDRAFLENLVPYLVRGHAYPFGMYNNEVKTLLKSAGILYARTVISTHSFELPADFLEWNPTCHHSEPELMTLAKQFCEQEPLWNQPQLFYVWGHAYEFDAEQNWDMMEQFMNYISGFSDRIWMATNGEIAEYIRAYQSLFFSADGKKVYNPSSTVVWMESLNRIYSILPGTITALD